MLFVAEKARALLSKETTPNQAISHFSETVVGTCRNFFGDSIVIAPREQNHMFQGKNPHSGTFLLARARRLPWILPTLSSSNVVRISNQEHRDIRELYLAEIGVFRMNAGRTVVYPEYFCVVVNQTRRKKRTVRKFVTAYPIKPSRYFDYLEKLPSAYPARE
ncbi:MAG: hypothetical protein H6684_16210 [Deltaproteobacteria bacterium]|nr:hypothetical protein [bacterium]MCB9479274.1 hypothetical protein [Deltaproteobacteria bacterium]MCB9490276.1 hypothetical protein [Deltaproteobacteria bacterium]